MRHEIRWPAAMLSVVLALSVLGLPAVAVTAPEDGAAAKEAGFVVVPPWQEGKSHSVKCGYGCGLHQHTASTDAPNDQYALDFDLGSDDAVYPVADGTVVYTGPGLSGATTGWTGYGDLVYVQHRDGYSSLYAHLGSMDVESGDPVTTATPLGTAGESGTEGGVHLHFALYQGAVTDERGMWYGGVSVVPEPFAQCEGDCEDLVSGSELTRTASGSPSGAITAEPPSGTPVARPEAIPARVPWSAEQAHRVISRYDLANPEGVGLLVDLDVPDTVYPLYGGEVIHAGCAGGRSAPLGRSVIVRLTLNDHTYDAVYGHLASIDPAIAGASALTPIKVGPNEPLGTAGAPAGVDLDPCPGETDEPDRLYVGMLRDAELLPGGELSGGRPVYAEPLIGRGAYEGFTWWKGPATAIDLGTGNGNPTGWWVKRKSVKDGQDIAFGDTVTLVAKVKDDVPIREVRFTAYYPDWARPKSVARLDGFDPRRTWRILAVCRPPGTGGEPKKTKGCKWDGSATNATVTYTWDPTLPQKGKPAPWQPIPRTAITTNSKECVPVSLSFDIYDSAGYRTLGPAGAKIVQHCRKPTDKPGVVVNLRSLLPPTAPSNVRVKECGPRDPDIPDDLWQPPECWNKRADWGFNVRWRDNSVVEDAYRVEVRYRQAFDTGKCRDGVVVWRFEWTPWQSVATLPAGTTRYGLDSPGYRGPGETAEAQVSVVAVNDAGENRSSPASLYGGMTGGLCEP